MTPQGHYTILTMELKALTRVGDLTAFGTYLGGSFRDHIGHVAPAKVSFVLAAVERAKAACTARTRLPAKPKPCTAKGAKLDWAGNPALRARLAHLYAKHGPTNHAAVAATLRMSVGQVRLAKRRFIDAAATQHRAAAA